MALVKNKATQERKDFWAHCEAVAEEVKKWPGWMRGEKSTTPTEDSMPEWNETCSQAGCNKSAEEKEVLPKRGQEAPRERRATPNRISDLSRAVEKAEKNCSVEGYASQPQEQMIPGQIPHRLLGPIPPASPELKGLLDILKNTPESLKQLRWAIYEAIGNYEVDLGRTACNHLRMKVEDLFMEYTNS